MNQPETATSIRYRQAERELARRVRSSEDAIQQAEAIARHYVAHAMLAKDILDMLKLRREIPKGHEHSTEGVDWCISREVEFIKSNHAKDFGIELEWMEGESKPQNPDGLDNFIRKSML